MVGVPATVPVAVSMDRPAGRPLADHEAIVAVGDEPVALLPRAVMGVPARLDWLPGLVTPTVAPVPVIAQVKLAEPETPRLSVAITTVG